MYAAFTDDVKYTVPSLALTTVAPVVKHLDNKITILYNFKTLSRLLW